MNLFTRMSYEVLILCFNTDFLLLICVDNLLDHI